LRAAASRLGLGRGGVGARAIYEGLGVRAGLAQRENRAEPDSIFKAESRLKDDSELKTRPTGGSPISATHGAGPTCYPKGERENARAGLLQLGRRMRSEPRGRLGRKLGRGAATWAVASCWASGKGKLSGAKTRRE